MIFCITLQRSNMVVEALETEDLSQEEMAEIVDFTGQWIERDEWVTLEFDTEKNSCAVVRRNHKNYSY